MRIANFVSFILTMAISTPVLADTWSDAEISFLKGSEFHDNSNNENIEKTIFTFQYAGGYKFGRNFFFVDALKSTTNDNKHAEIYGEYYHSLSLGSILGFDWGKNVIRDFSLTGGLNYGAKNSEFGPHPEVYLFGTTIDWNIPGFAFFNLDILAYRDNSSFSGFGGGLACRERSTTYQITPVWKLPFNLGSHKLSFEGFVDLIGKHGSCEQQVLAQPQLRWDIGHYFGQSDTVYIGVEYLYWTNKYGIKGRHESFPQALFTWKL